MSNRSGYKEKTRKCIICDFVGITRNFIKHLKTIHNFNSLREYKLFEIEKMKIKWPKCVCGKSVHYNEYKDIFGKACCHDHITLGDKHTEEHKKKIGDRSKKNWEDENFRQKVLLSLKNPEIKKKQYSKESIAKRVASLSIFYKTKEGLELRRKRSNDKKIYYMNHPEKIPALHKGSKEEIKFVNHIKGFFENAERNKRIPIFNELHELITYKVPDIYIPELNTIIEFDGTFFHPAHKNKHFKPIQLNNLKNDLIKNFLYANEGYNFFRIHETESEKFINTTNKDNFVNTLKQVSYLYSFNGDCFKKDGVYKKFIVGDILLEKEKVVCLKELNIPERINETIDSCAFLITNRSSTDESYDQVKERVKKQFDSNLDITV